MLVAVHATRPAYITARCQRRQFCRPSDAPGEAPVAVPKARRSARGPRHAALVGVARHCASKTLYWREWASGEPCSRCAAELLLALPSCRQPRNLGRNLAASSRKDAAPDAKDGPQTGLKVACCHTPTHSLCARPPSQALVGLLHACSTSTPFLPSLHPLLSL
jgi:hypothetical protein